MNMRVYLIIPRQESELTTDGEGADTDAEEGGREDAEDTDRDRYIIRTYVDAHFLVGGKQ